MAKPIQTLGNIATNQAANVALGVAPNSVPPSLISGNQNQTLFFQRVTVPPNSTYPVVVSGNYLYVEGIAFDTTDLSYFNTADELLTVKPDTIDAKTRLISSKRAITFPKFFNNLQFENTSTIAVVVSCWIGSGDIRADYDGYLINSSFTNYLTGPGVPYAIGQNVGFGNSVLEGCCSKYNQRATLKHILVTKSSPVVANADFSLWLFATNTNSTFPIDKSAFNFGAAYYPAKSYLGQIRLNPFVTGGAGSTWAACDVADINVSLYSKVTDLRTYGLGTIYGTVVANAPYVPSADESMTVNLTLEWK
jgi:hypothetical protein